MMDCICEMVNQKKKKRLVLFLAKEEILIISILPHTAYKM